MSSITITNLFQTVNQHCRSVSMSDIMQGLTKLSKTKHFHCVPFLKAYLYHLPTRKWDGRFPMARSKLNNLLRRLRDHFTSKSLKGHHGQQPSLKKNEVKIFLVLKFLKATNKHSKTSQGIARNRCLLFYSNIGPGRPFSFLHWCFLH
jgi:hypothetical protein